MKTVIGVKFKKTNKIYYFDPGEHQVEVGDQVVVETAQGSEVAEVVIGAVEIAETQIVSPLKSVLRKVNESDRKKAERNRKSEADAFKIFESKVAERNLDMKPVDVEYAFDGSKITFFFTADGRVDFRELVKDLAHHFRTRIELRQIGVRDEAKMLGGIGKCGCAICCKQFLPEFTPVSIKMAKEQNISLNPSKISGLCGRLMCCLNFEQKYYEEMKRKMPKIGQAVKTPDGKGTAVECNSISTKVRVKLEKADGMFEFRDYLLEDLKFEKIKKDDSKKSSKKEKIVDPDPELLEVLD